MTEASRVQKMLNEQNAWIDQLKSEVMRLNLELVGYKVRKIQLEEALREIASISKIICKSEDMTEALILTLKSYRDLALKALDDAP